MQENSRKAKENIEKKVIDREFFLIYNRKTGKLYCEKTLIGYCIKFKHDV